MVLFGLSDRYFEGKKRLVHAFPKSKGDDRIKIQIYCRTLRFWFGYFHFTQLRPLEKCQNEMNVFFKLEVPAFPTLFGRYQIAVIANTTLLKHEKERVLRQ